MGQLGSKGIWCNLELQRAHPVTTIAITNAIEPKTNGSFVYRLPPCPHLTMALLVIRKNCLPCLAVIKTTQNQPIVQNLDLGFP